jgi:hypothetical protein
MGLGASATHPRPYTSTIARCCEVGLPRTGGLEIGRRQGTYLLITVGGEDGSEHLLAKYGTESWASQAPTHPQQIYVEEVWPADAQGIVDAEVLQRAPTRGMWVSADKIARLEVMHLSSLGSG